MLPANSGEPAKGNGSSRRHRTRKHCEASQRCKGGRRPWAEVLATASQCFGSCGKYGFFPPQIYSHWRRRWICFGKKKQFWWCAAMKNGNSFLHQMLCFSYVWYFTTNQQAPLANRPTCSSTHFACIRSSPDRTNQGWNGSINCSLPWSSGGTGSRITITDHPTIANWGFNGLAFGVFRHW